MSIPKSIPSLLLSFLAISLTGCDPEHQEKCEWYLVPDENRTSQVKEGYVPACARNYVINKQDCRLQVELESAKQLEKKKFRYVDMKVATKGNPRTVMSVKHCE